MLSRSSRPSRSLPISSLARSTISTQLVPANRFGWGLALPASLAAAAALAQPVHSLDTITVQGQAIDASGPVQGYVADHSMAATKTATPLSETTQSMSVIGREEMDDRGVQSVTEAVAYTAGVQAAAQGEDNRQDEFTIRGFNSGSSSGSTYLDGLRVPVGGQWNWAKFDTYGLERVEVIKGPSAVLYGQVAPGGLVNMVSKRPTAMARGEVRLGVGSDGKRLGAFDSSGPIDEAGQWRYRTVATVSEGGAALRHTDMRRTFLAPSLTWQPSASTDVTWLAQYQKDRGGSTFQFLPSHGTLYPAAEGRIGQRTFLGEPDWNRYDRDQYAVGYAATHRVSEHLTLRQNARYTKVDTLFRGVMSSGDTLPDGRTIRRRAVWGDGTSRGTAIDTQAQADFRTGSLAHTALLGVDWQRSRQQNVRQGAGRGVGNIDIFDPVYTGTQQWRGWRTQVDQDATLRQTGVYLQDQIAVEGWRVTLAGRHDWAASRQINGMTRQRSQTRDHAATGRIGVGHVFDNGLMPYASYATSFEPVMGATYDGTPFVPTTGKQYEVGVKFEPARDALITLAYYSLTQHNILTPDPDPTHLCGERTCSVQTGKSRTRGVELEGKATVLPGWQLTAAYTYMDGRITRSNSGEQGNRLPRVPHNMVSLWSDYTIATGPLQGVGLGAGVRRVGDTYGDSANRFEIPAYTLFDAAVRYDLGKVGVRGAQLALTATNLADKRYVATCTGPAGCHYGQGRTVMGTVSMRW